MFLDIAANIDRLSASVIAITTVALVLLDRIYGLERLLVGRGREER